MASNFKALLNRKKNDWYVSLMGDFDGSSAHELVNMLKSAGRKVGHIYIDTDQLAQLNPFGLEMFESIFKELKPSHADRVRFLGKKAKEMEPL